MAEHHLEYGYLEAESYGMHFTEDPVSIVVFVGNQSRADKRASSSDRASK